MYSFRGWYSAIAGAPSCTEIGELMTLSWQEFLPVQRLVTD